MNFNRRLDTGFYPHHFQSVLQGEAVDDGGHHPHVIRRHPFHSQVTGGGAAKNISPTDDDGHLDAQLFGLKNFEADIIDCPLVDAESAIHFGQALAAQF